MANLIYRVEGVKSVMENSKHISNFLNFLEDIKMEYNISVSIEKDADAETQDILHRLEFENDSCDNMVKISQLIKPVRQKRRKAKRQKAEAEPVIQWINRNTSTIHELKKLLGDVRKAEEYNANRYYINKTDILNVLEKVEKMRAVFNVWHM